MPNWCKNILKVSSNLNVQDFHRFKAIFEEREKGMLQEFYPMPDELRDTQSPSRSPNQDLIALYGFDNWYEWSIHHWSIKWDVCEKDDKNPDWTYSCDLENECLTFIFDSPWGPPINALHTIAEQFPGLLFELIFEEPMMNFEGKYIWSVGSLNEKINREFTGKFKTILQDGIEFQEGPFPSLAHRFE